MVGYPSDSLASCYPWNLIVLYFITTAKQVIKILHCQTAMFSLN